MNITPKYSVYDKVWFIMDNTVAKLGNVHSINISIKEDPTKYKGVITEISYKVHCGNTLYERYENSLASTKQELIDRL